MHLGHYQLVSPRHLLPVLLLGCDVTMIDGPGLPGTSVDGLEPGEAAAPTEPTDPPTSLECDYDRDLYGMDGSQPTNVGPIAVGNEGANICVHLDTRDNILVGHFAAATKREVGTESSFEMTLMATDGTVIRDGWDVTYGSSPSQTSAHLENGFDKGQLVDAILAVRTRAGVTSETTDVHLWLFEPYE